MKININETQVQNPLQQKKITICLSYYNQGKELLLNHINEWKQYPQKDKFSFFIIDDCSEIPVEKILKDIELSDLDVHIYRVEEDLYCNIAGVRNLGAKECKTEWMMIIDMDTLLPKELSNKLLDLTEGKGISLTLKIKILANKRDVSYRFGVIRNGKVKPHPAVCLVKTKVYWEIGGCDEDLVGHYGQTDRIFWYRAIGKINIIIMENLILETIEEASAKEASGNKLIKDKKHNSLLFAKKDKTQKWSTDHIRFKWRKVVT